jgi:uncharacterized small protein (DUF1192 family)
MTTTPIHNLTDVWADGATTFNAIKMNVTDTASAAASKLFLLQVDGVDKVAIDKDGAFQDSLFAIADNADRTKRVQFQVSGVTTGTTRTLTVPDFDGTIATLAGTETFTNKTLTSPTITTPTFVTGETIPSGYAITSSGATTEAVTAATQVPVFNVAGHRRVLTDNTVLNGYGHQNIYIKPEKTSQANQAHEAWISRYDDQGSPGSDHWEHWLVYQSPLAHDSGLTGAPANAQAFRAVGAEYNPVNRLSDQGYAKERRLGGSWMGGPSLVPETQDFSALLGNTRVGYHVHFGYHIGQSAYVCTENNRTAKTYNGFLIEPNAMAPDGRGAMFHGHRDFVTAVAISSGGTGYTANDVGKVVVIEGPGSSAVDIDATAIIRAVAAGAVTEVELYTPGFYATAPSNPVTPNGNTTITNPDGSTTAQTLDGAGLTLNLTISTEAEYPHAAAEIMSDWHCGLDFTLADFTDSVGGSNHAARFDDGHVLAWRNSAGSEYRNVLGVASDQAYISAVNNSNGVFIGSENFGNVIAHFDASATTRNAYPDFRADDGLVRISAAGSASNSDIEIIPKGAGRTEVYGAGGAPSLSANCGSFVARSLTSVQVATGGYSDGAFEAWMQTKQTTNSGTAFNLSINPLGGNVAIGKRTSSHKLDVDGDINVDSGHFYRVGGTPVIGARVVDANLADTAALTAEALTDNSGGTASNTIAAIGATYSQSEVANAIASLADEINKLRADNAAQKTALDAALTLIRTHGLGATS